MSLPDNTNLTIFIPFILMQTTITIMTITVGLVLYSSWFEPKYEGKEKLLIELQYMGKS